MNNFFVIFNLIRDFAMIMNKFKEVLDKVNNLQLTENGAVGLSSTGNSLVDLNFRVPSNHNNIQDDDIRLFTSACSTDIVDAVKWLFFLRDVREGLGERDSFVKLFLCLCVSHKETALKVLSLVPEFGRWKDVVDMLEYIPDSSELAKAIYDMINVQLVTDGANCVQGKPVSLLAKWLPSINASQKARNLAIRIKHALELNSASYRKMLAKLRKYIDVTEVKTCGDKWGEIDYNKVSSNANARYLRAFMKHDPERRKKYLDDLAHPETTGAVMHASDLYPYEVYAKYRDKMKHDPYLTHVDEDPAIEALWKNLKEIESAGNTMVVCDGSGSMCWSMIGTSVKPIDVSRSLAVYFAERCEGEFHNKVIEFSSNPHYIDLSNCDTLADKFNVMARHHDCSNTNLERVFSLLLKTALDNNLPQEELPQRILIVSDMEFDSACEFQLYFSSDNHNGIMDKYQTLFDGIKSAWKRAGYTMPDIVFWNVNSRTNTIPVSKNECGVILVSGFSVNNAKMILSGEVDPWMALKSVLDSDRYKVIEEKLK